MPRMVIRFYDAENNGHEMVSCLVRVVDVCFQLEDIVNNLMSHVWDYSAIGKIIYFILR